MSYALLFSGQSSQHADMMPWLETEPACRPLLNQMADRIGADWRQQLQAPSRRANNAFAQVLVTGTAVAAWSALQSHLSEPPSVVAGYSVGELPAFGCAGVLAPAQLLELAAVRAQLMNQAVAHLRTGMLAVTGIPESTVLSACSSLGLECAIQVGPQHNIFAGTDASLQQALPLLAALGANGHRLEVEVASHSSWMRAAANDYAKALSSLTFASPQCPVALNALGQISRRPDQLREALSRQLASTVQWSSVMDAIAERQVDCVLEIGGGSALSRMWNDRHSHMAARSLDDFRHPQSAAAWMRKAGAISA
jgi:[acyl-carrier-protein] S-malonyltransferase